MSKIDAKDRFYYNTDFLSSPSGRSVRILSEYYGPLQKLQRNKISDTIVFFGSARTPSKEDAEKALKKAPKEIDTAKEFQGKIEDIPKNILNFFDSIGEGYCKNREKN